MTKSSDFESIRKIRDRLNSAKDDAVVNLSVNAMSHIKNILRFSKGESKTTSYHTIAQKYEKLDAALESLNESIRFLSESQGGLKRDWEVLVTTDAHRAKEALFSLLSSCELLDGDDTGNRINSESQILEKILKKMEKITGSSPKSIATFAKLSIEFEHSLKNLDNVLGGTAYPADRFDVYSKFSSDLEDLGERIGRLEGSLRFYKDEYTKEDWHHFMKLDRERLNESIKISYNSSMQLINVAT